MRGHRVLRWLVVVLVVVGCAAPGPRGGTEPGGSGVAASGDAQPGRQLRTFDLTLLRIKERYVDPGRIAPRAMLYAALDAVQRDLPEVQVEPDAAHDRVVVEVSGQRESFGTDGITEMFRLSARLKRAVGFITAHAPGLDTGAIEHAAIRGVLSTLDPDSQLDEPEPPSPLRSPVSTPGRVGLVIRRRIIDDKLIVVRPLADGPAARAGVQRGDHLVKIDQELTEGLTSAAAVDRLSGAIGSDVTLWISRQGAPALVRVELKRAIVRASEVSARLLGNGVGMIRVGHLVKGVADDVVRAMDDLRAGGARAWVLDLRGSEGGLLEQAMQLADLFVDAGTLVTTVWGTARETRNATRGRGDVASPLVVLVSRRTAAGAEIVASALRDLDRAVLVGARTFGRASIQELISNPDGSSLRLTVARWETAGSRSLQGVGLVPDTAVRGDRPTGATAVHPVLELDVPPAPPKPPSSIPAADADPDDLPAPDDVEVGLAVELAASSTSATRSGLLERAKPAVARIQAREDQRGAAALATAGIDWSAPAAAGGGVLEATLGGPTAAVQAGGAVALTLTVTNRGTAPAWRVVARLRSEDALVDGKVLPIGKIAPGETRTVTTQLEVPRSAPDRAERIAATLRDASGAEREAAPIGLVIAAAPRPEFAYRYQLIDDGNGDGMVQRGEGYRLRVTVQNIGEAASPVASVAVRNASIAGIVLDDPRCELGELAPGAERSVEIPLRVTNRFGRNELVLALTVYDSHEAVAGEELRIPLEPAVSLVAGQGTAAILVDRAELRSAASAAGTRVGWASKGAAFPVLGTAGAWTKLDLGGGQPGFVRSAEIGPGQGAPSFTPYWQARPPGLVLTVTGLDTAADRYSLRGTATDDEGVHDVVVLVSNASAGITGRKAYYRSNRGSRTPARMELDASIPLWPGSNEVVVVARGASQRIRTLFVHRSAAPPRGGKR
jgi:carboxyl-terminal processing protease